MPNSIIEFGANIGMNLKAIKALYPKIDFYGVEITKSASEILKTESGEAHVYLGSVLDFS